MDMHEKIAFLREKNKMTLEQVANIVGVTKSTVKKWEDGSISNMKRDKIALLAKALKTTPAYLMGWDEPVNDSEISEMMNYFDTYDVDISVDAHLDKRGDVYRIVTYKGKQRGEIADELYDFYIKSNHITNYEELNDELDYFFAEHDNKVTFELKDELKEDKGLRRIARAREKMSKEKLAEMDDFLERMYGEFFSKDENK